MVLTAFVLLLGAAWLWRRAGARKQAILMLILAIVIAINVAIWTVPDSSGDTPLNSRPETAG